MTTTQKHRFSAGSRPVTAALVLSAVFAVLVLLPGIRPAAAPYRTVTSAVGLEVRYANGEWRTFDGSEPVNYTGVAHNAAGWWFCRNGTVDFNYTGIQPNDAGWWRIVGGKVDFGCNTIEHNDAGWWKCTGGKVDFGYTGVWYNAAGWWYCRNGKVDFNYTGLSYNDAGWWRIFHGMVDFGFGGTVPNAAGLWTVSGGKVDFSYGNGGPGFYKTHPYRLTVNTRQNLVIAYGRSSDGSYNTPVKAFVSSCGVFPNDRTKTGHFYTEDKWTWEALYGGVYGQYATRITGPYLFHSVPYYTRSKSNLEYLEYNKLGSNASLGCVRLCVADAKWIYDNCPSGTEVDVYDDGGFAEPMAKPAPIRIDTSSPYRGWDPTDPDPANPWH